MVGAAKRHYFTLWIWASLNVERRISSTNATLYDKLLTLSGFSLMTSCRP
jgi:hypothetical protein